MAFVPPKDRVLEHSTSNSQTVFAVTGALDLSYNAFSSAMSVGDTTIGAVVEMGVAFAAGVLTYSAANQVTVTTAFASKGTFSSSGVKEVFMGMPATQATKGPTQQILTGSGTYTPPAGCFRLEIEAVGAGGGGAGSGTSPGNGAAGGATTFGSGPLINATGGNGGTGSNGGTATTPSGGYLNLPGNPGQAASGVSTANPGGDGGAGPFGGAGKGGVSGAGSGQNGQAATGAGAGGGGVNTTPNGGGGGASGGYVRATINAPAGSYAYAVGAGGTSGANGTGGAAGGTGGAGTIIVREFYA